MTAANRPEGPDLSRRDFVKTVGAGALAAAVLLPGQTRAPAEGAVARFYESLGGDQKAQICFPFDHPLRSRVHANWAIVEPRIGDLNPAQQALCGEIFQTLCSDDGRDRFLRQMAEDYGGFARYHVALFGEPGTGTPSEWVITGRHVTLRAGDLASSGPIFYGHAAQGGHGASGRTGNVWQYQAERADAIFETLDATQKSQARLGEIGLPVGDLNGSQKAMVQGLLKDLLQPFRTFPAEGAQSFLHDADSLRLTGFRDVWKLEGPGFSWFFHGTPHVHAWVNVGG